MKARRESPKQYRNGDKTNQHNTEHNTEAKQNQPEQKNGHKTEQNWMDDHENENMEGDGRCEKKGNRR